MRYGKGPGCDSNHVLIPRRDSVLFESLMVKSMKELL